MTWTAIGSLAMVWWNTSLTPPVAKRKATEADLEFVVAQICELQKATEFAILALGEVCLTDLHAIVEGLGGSHFELHDATDRSSKPMFDTAVIYDRRKVEFVANSSIKDSYGTKTLKTAEHVTFRVVETDVIFQIFVSHWPSRLSYGDLDPTRFELGTALRRRLENPSTDHVTPYFILIGDYNDEPFSRSLANHLLATRDRSLARRKRTFLYNPFWRTLGESVVDAEDDNEIGICGTHFYANGDHSKWFTFDQIIFSSAFLQGKDLVLNEQRCGILALPLLREKLLDRQEIFDHLPVVGTIDLRIES